MTLTPRSQLVSIVVRCMDCGDQVSAETALTICPVCGGLLDVVLPFTAAVDRGFPGSDLPMRLQRSGVWRYRSLLPAIPDKSIVTRWEGNTPQFEDERLSRFAGLQQLSLKHEGQNPTASFKDRGMTVGISHANAIGARIVVCASTGNTSASLASYAAAARMVALVLIPEGKISGGKLAQTIAHGARIVQVRGDFDVAMTLLRDLTDRYPVYLVNSLNPFRLEGQKTIVFEMLEQRNWKIPDVIALPGGNLGNTAAFGKALADLRQAGLIDRQPRIATIQAAGAAPFYHYYQSGFDQFSPVVAETIATAIKIGNPASVGRARRTIEQSGGVVESVTDEEIMAAKALIDAVGIGCEPASAATLAGLRKLVARGEIAPDADVVGVLTGHVLKDADAVVHYHLGEQDDLANPGANRPVTIDATLGDLERTLADALNG